MADGAHTPGADRPRTLATVAARTVTARHRRGSPTSQVAPPSQLVAVTARLGSAAPSQADGCRCQNFSPPIMPATFVVTSEIVGAMDELAR